MVRSRQTSAIASAIARAREHAAQLVAAEVLARRAGRNFVTRPPPARCRPAASSSSTPLSRWMHLVDVRLGARVVRDHHDRLPELLLQLAQQRRAIVLGVLRVEVAGGLVGDDELGVGDDRARDRDALLLAARELAREWSRAVREPDDAQRRRGALAPLGLREVGEQQRQLDVLARGEHRDQVEELEDEAHVARAQGGELVLGEVVQALARPRPPRRRRPVEAREEVEERRLARARRAHQRDEAALRDVQASRCSSAWTSSAPRR